MRPPAQTIIPHLWFDKEAHAVVANVPRELDEMLSTGTPEQRARVTAAFLDMKKTSQRSGEPGELQQRKMNGGRKG